MIDVLKSDLDPLLQTFNPEDVVDDKDAEELVEMKLEEYRAPVVDFANLPSFDDDDGLKRDFLEARRILVDTIDRAKKISDIAFDSMIIKNGDPVLLGIAGESNKTVQASVKSLVDLHMQSHKVINQKIKNKKEIEEPEGGQQPKEDSRFASVGGIPTMIPKENKS